MKRSHQRSGASLVVVLALLVVCATIVLQLLSSSLRQRMQLRRDLQKQQTQWLLRAGAGYVAAESMKADFEPPESVDVEIPHFDSVRLNFTTETSSPQTSALTITAQIGDPKRPTQLTSLSSQYKINVPKQKAIQEKKNEN